MRCYTHFFCKLVFVLTPFLSFSIPTNAQTDKVIIDEFEVTQGTFIIPVAPVTVESVVDPANHQCCVTPPPSSIFLSIDGGIITVESEDPDHWLNFETELGDGLFFQGATTAEVAGFEDVNNTFIGEVFENIIRVEATLGVEGELFDQTIVYNLEIDPGNAFGGVDPASIPQETATKVKAVGGSASNASFASGASADGGATTKTQFTSSDDVTIAGTINIDPADQGMAGEVYVVLLSVTNDGPVLSFMNEDGNYEVWDQTIAGLGSHIKTNSLEESYNVTISTGTLQEGTYRVALAYSKGGKLVYAPKAIVVKVID